MPCVVGASTLLHRRHAVHPACNRLHLCQLVAVCQQARKGGLQLWKLLHQQRATTTQLQQRHEQQACCTPHLLPGRCCHVTTQHIQDVCLHLCTGAGSSLSWHWSAVLASSTGVIGCTVDVHCTGRVQYSPSPTTAAAIGLDCGAAAAAAVGGAGTSSGVYSI